MPFDNRFAIVDVKGKHLRKLVVVEPPARRRRSCRGAASTAKARCKADTLDVEITRRRQAARRRRDRTSSSTSDFLASGGDGVIGRLKLPDGAITMTDAIIRDAIADVLRKTQGHDRSRDSCYSPAKRRLDYEGKRPVECGERRTQADAREEPTE